MAYGVKYRIEFTAKSLVNWRIDLLKNDYAGPIIERNHGADEPNFEFDIEKSIGGVKFDFSIETTTADNTGLTDLFVEDPRDFQVIVYRETTAVWYGFLVPEQYSDNYVYPPYDISLSAVDGLGLLKNEDFTLTGVKSEIEILTYILEKTGLSLPIGVCVHIFPQGVATNRAPLQNVFQDCSAFATSSDVPKCYDVLEIILQSYGEKTYITQQNGRWFVFREIDLGNDIHVYTSGNYSATESAPAPIALGRGLTLEPVGNLVRSVEKRFHRIEVTHDLGKKTNMFLPGIINQAAGEFYAGFQRAKYWTRYATSQYPRIVRYGANAELLLLIAGAYNNPGAISDPVYYIKNSRPLVFKLDYGIAYTRSNGYTGVQPIYVKIKIGNYFLNKTGWSLNSYTWELPKLAKDNFTNWGVLADPPPASGNLVVEIYNNALTPGCYIRSFEFNYAEETAFQAKNTYSLNNANSVINTLKYEVIGDIVPDENAHLIYTRYKRLSDGTPTQNWKFPSTANFYSLALCNCRLEASNNRKARQKFTGSLSGVLPGYFFRINHTDAGITTPLYPQKATLNIFSGELTGEFLEWLPFVEQTITVAINEDYKATGSGGSGASGGGGGGSSVVSTPVLWDNVNSKPPFVENINSYFAIGDNNGVAYIRALKDLHVEGNLYQQGTAYETHVEHLFSKNDFIILREDAVSGLPSNQLSGFKILKANGTVNLILGAGNDAIARVGWEGGTLQAIATRADTPTNNGIAVWDNANNRFSTPYLVSDFPRKAENAVISGAWRFGNNVDFSLNDAAPSGKSIQLQLGVTGQGHFKIIHDFNTRQIRFQSDSSWGSQFDSLTWLLRDSSGTRERMRLTNTGNLGIGTTSPSERLHVDGNVRIVGGSLQMNSDGTTSFWGGEHAGLTASGEMYFRAEGTNNIFRIYKNTVIEGDVKLDTKSAVDGTFRDINFNGSSSDLGVNQSARIRFTRTASGALGSISFQVRRSDNLTTAERMLISNDEVLFHTRINSPTFITGFAGNGWRLDTTDNHLTVDKLTVRGQMSVYELVVNQIRATNGSLWVSDAIKTTTAFRESGWDNRYIHFNFDNDNGNRACPFIVNDIVQAQRFNGRSIVKIVGVVYQSFGTYFRVDTNNYMTAYGGSLTELDGLEFVRIGHTSVRLRTRPRPARRNAGPRKGSPGGRNPGQCFCRWR